MLLLLLIDEKLTITLENLFHISTGILEERHERSIEINNAKRKVWFLHMGDMRSSDGLIDFENLEQNEADLIENRLRREQRKKKLKTNEDDSGLELIPVSEKKLIQPTDYLLCVRGVPTGYSMIRSMNELKNHQQFQNFISIATHHFIVLKLRENYSSMNINYIHLILDSLVRNELFEMYKQKKNVVTKDKVNSNKYPQSVIITGIKEIKDIKLTILKKLEKQNELVKLNEEIIEETQKVKTKSLIYLRSLNKLN